MEFESLDIVSVLSTLDEGERRCVVSACLKVTLSKDVTEHQKAVAQLLEIPHSLPRKPS